VWQLRLPVAITRLDPLDGVEVMSRAQVMNDFSSTGATLLACPWAICSRMQHIRFIMRHACAVIHMSVVWYLVDLPLSRVSDPFGDAAHCYSNGGSESAAGIPLLNLA
jgi:hypothetical protein